MLDRADEALSVRRQCALRRLPRSGVYRAAKTANDNDAALTRRIDERLTAWPFIGSRRMTATLRAEGSPLKRKRVQRLMRASWGPRAGERSGLRRARQRRRVAAPHGSRRTDPAT
ncbi:helix-turn-helix protein [Roseiarcus fermentans]|uniref:Helix-turn-helix protein n=1 Tax=Roseiarcus fermentans TaxID=1473586 RepID=A0A366ESS3_9HYPH|nr:IS3 family transposase [Roseiarcus fermentans]RBP04569.1 helix-turn-helix protein [Roseiarcus fermentans]